MVTLTSTVNEAKVWLRENFDKGECCPVCNQFVKLYRRNLNSAMAYSLILLDRYFRTSSDEWVHAPSYLRSMKARDRDLGYLKFWGVIEEKPCEREDGGKHAGFYRITEDGKRFVAGTTRLPKYIFLYNRELIQRPSPKTVDIREALGTKFNYNELMGKYAQEEE